MRVSEPNKGRYTVSIPLQKHKNTLKWVLMLPCLFKSETIRVEIKCTALLCNSFFKIIEHEVCHLNTLIYTGVSQNIWQFSIDFRRHGGSIVVIVLIRWWKHNQWLNSCLSHWWLRLLFWSPQRKQTSNVICRMSYRSLYLSNVYANNFSFSYSNASSSYSLNIYFTSLLRFLQKLY